MINKPSDSVCPELNHKNIQLKDDEDTIPESEARQKDIANAKKQQEDSEKEETIKKAPKVDENFASANYGINYNQKN